MKKLILICLVVAAIQLSCINALDFEKEDMSKVESLVLESDKLTSTKRMLQEECIPKEVGDDLCSMKHSKSVTCQNWGFKEGINGPWHCYLSTSKSDSTPIHIQYCRFGCEYLPEGDGKTWAIKGSCWVKYTVKH